jgi:hypothetical protein
VKTTPNIEHEAIQGTEEKAMQDTEEKAMQGTKEKAMQGTEEKALQEAEDMTTVALDAIKIATCELTSDEPASDLRLAYEAFHFLLESKSSWSTTEPRAVEDVEWAYEEMLKHVRHYRESVLQHEVWEEALVAEREYLIPSKAGWNGNTERIESAAQFVIASFALVFFQCSNLFVYVFNPSEGAYDNLTR